MTKKNEPRFGSDFYQLRKDSGTNTIRVLDSNGTEVQRIYNRKGESASFLIYTELAHKFSGKLHYDSARYGLALYGDYTTLERATPNSHPNVRRLISIIETHQEMTLLLEKQV